MDLKAETGKIDVPLGDYYRTAGSLLEQANGYREEGNIINLYITLERFSSLVGETIPRHPDYRVILAKKRSIYIEKLSAVMSELQSIKLDVYQRVTELNKAYKLSQSAHSTNQQITSDLETSQTSYLTMRKSNSTPTPSASFDRY